MLFRVLAATACDNLGVLRPLAKLENARALARGIQNRFRLGQVPLRPSRRCRRACQCGDADTAWAAAEIVFDVFPVVAD